jgi:hypothetical protein
VGKVAIVTGGSRGIGACDVAEYTAVEAMLDVTVQRFG